ncbi:SDR family oxidoreductase [Acuticoccus sp. MNP-M23]|uniref:SDR family oxidoreductase n=1 Tax=Acuticoccus sp. MNP-M23 TaxID=3072793 RepID=UPI002815A60D|nr:SDR family oxidoreductase [Acuticoccus sp. MNP-M23]WMS44668.1 SDR family oxidoreductase [Acuticoccus sp. MNP-M23]
MDLGLNNKVALVLGAGGGLGSAIALSLGAEGAKVAVADIDENAAKVTADAVNAAGGTAFAISWDLADVDSVDAKVSAVEAELGSVDVFVAITGGPPPGGVAGVSSDTWRKFFDSMVVSVFAITDRVLPGMRERKWGRIITSTSSGVVAPIPNLGLSNALRATLLGWSKTLAAEVGRDGVTANIVLPGRVATKRITFLDEKKAEREGRPVEDVKAESNKAIPLGRYGDPKEYGDTVAFLASERASYITGSVIRVDGGYIPSI